MRSRCTGRENQRWLREREDRQEQSLQETKTRQEQWQQETKTRQEQWQREDSLRWHQERQHAYARLMAALDEWDPGLGSVASNLQVDAQLNEHTEIDLDELTRLGTPASQASALVQLMTPKAVRSLVQAAINDRQGFRTHCLVPRVLNLPGRPSDFTDLNERWAGLHKRKSSLRDAMRDDLGIEGKQSDAASAGDIEGA